jgi:hypothetical protein
LAVSTTVVRSDESSVGGGESKTSAFSDVFRRITMGITGLGVTT